MEVKFYESIISSWKIILFELVYITLTVSYYHMAVGNITGETMAFNREVRHMIRN